MTTVLTTLPRQAAALARHPVTGYLPRPPRCEYLYKRTSP
jgi:hypothetical protein